MLTEIVDEVIRERALTHARRARHADDIGFAGMGIQASHLLESFPRLVLNKGDKTGGGLNVSF